MGRTAHNLLNKKFGYLEVLERAPNRKKEIMWKCKCVCGNEPLCSTTHLLRNQISCGCKLYGKDSKCWNGYGEISGSRWAHIKRNRRYEKNTVINITIKYVWNLFLKQNRLCALSGVPIFFGKNRKEKTTASLDRIDNTKGYIKGNVQWVHKDVNKMKNIFNQTYFIDMCKNVVEYEK